MNQEDRIFDTLPGAARRGGFRRQRRPRTVKTETGSMFFVGMPPRHAILEFNIRKDQKLKKEY
jgi:hypothetical protein